MIRWMQEKQNLWQFDPVTEEKNMLVSPADFVAKAKATITECSVRDVHDNRDAGTLLVDIREPAEFSRGHLPGAVLVPRGLLEFDILPAIQRAGLDGDRSERGEPADDRHPGDR